MKCGLVRAESLDGLWIRPGVVQEINGEAFRARR
jgi:hypothetical protein